MTADRRPWPRAAVSDPRLLDRDDDRDGVVFVELWAIAWVQNRYMETPFWRAALQVVVGGALVFAAGILIGCVYGTRNSPSAGGVTAFSCGLGICDSQAYGTR